jgi:hypothetical protein
LWIVGGKGESQYNQKLRSVSVRNEYGICSTDGFH